MIYLGLNNKEKAEIVEKYCIDNGIKKVFILSLNKFKFNCTFNNHEFVEWSNIIEYVYFYRLLQEIDHNSLIVINECLRNQNRYDLTYNCIRLFLNQTYHQFIFQYIPIIDTVDDFFILFDFDTKSKWKREKRTELLKEVVIKVNPISIQFNPINVVVSNNLLKKYAVQKEKLIRNIGLKDPHTIPRNLYLISGKEKLNCVDKNKYYIGRNNRFKLSNLITYKENNFNNKCTVFEFCHNYIDFIDFLYLSKQIKIDVLVTDLKIDQWYLKRYNDWVMRINNVYTKI